MGIGAWGLVMRMRTTQATKTTYEIGGIGPSHADNTIIHVKAVDQVCYSEIKTLGFRIETCSLAQFLSSSQAFSTLRSFITLVRPW